LASVLSLFEEKTRSQPGAIAVSFAGRRITYGELNDRANQIGCALRNAGVADETLVAIYLERSPELVASLLGVWKAGGAYLPIDPTNPSQRVAFSLQDSKVGYVLTEASLIGSLPPTSARVLCLKALCSESTVEEQDSAASFIAAKPSPDQPAYVIYTSGSTGRPKGAEICHGGLLNVLESIGRDVALKPSDVVLASATIAFDISNEEIFLPLLAGASVHLLQREFVGDGRKLIEVMRNVSLVFGTPTSWRLVLEAGWQGDRNLQVIVGGEVLPLSLARTLAGMTKALWNHYGPTETSICATRERIAADAAEVTLGWPVENVRIYVLDKDLREMQAGEAGEIYIGGAGVGRGYLNRPELTARVFLPDPIANAPGARMYKTGDLGRVLPDGRLDFTGRVDNQVKLRGFRIELEEIEAAMREFSGVHAAVVQLVEHGADDQRLVAYFLGLGQVGVAELREFLRERLPFYMLPSELIPLESLPMTINGKVDRVALDTVRVKFEALATAESAQPPSDDLEAKLLALWQRLLKVKNVRSKDDFFELGGHSLLATRMFAEIEKMTGRKIQLSVLIQNPTVGELAAHIRSRPEPGWPGLVPIRERGSLPPLFIAHGLASNLLLFRELAESLGPNQPVYGIQLAAPENAGLEELRLEAFAARSVEEICAVDPAGPYYLAGHSLGGLLVFEIAAQLGKMGKEVGLLALLDCDPNVAQRAASASTGDPVPLKDIWMVWRKKFSRLFEGGGVDTYSRKILFEKLMFKIRLLRLIHRKGTYHPRLFGHDPYIAIFAERYLPRPIDADTVLFVAEDELAPEATEIPWSQALGGRLEVLRIPGSHQTILSLPHVSVLAGELTKRLDLSSRPRHSLITSRRNEPRQPMIHPVLEYHGG